MTRGKVVGVTHTGITVSDMDRALSFFCGVLGATATEPVLYTDAMFERITGVPDANINIAYVDLPGHRLELLQYVKPDSRKTSNLMPCDSGHLHLSLLVENIEDLVAEMAAAGFEQAGPIQEVAAEGGFKVIYTYGFDRLVIELMDFSQSGENTDEESA